MLEKLNIRRSFSSMGIKSYLEFFKKYPFQIPNLNSFLEDNSNSDIVSRPGKSFLEVFLGAPY